MADKEVRVVRSSSHFCVSDIASVTLTDAVSQSRGTGSLTSTGTNGVSSLISLPFPVGPTWSPRHVDVQVLGGQEVTERKAEVSNSKRTSVVRCVSQSVSQSVRRSAVGRAEPGRAEPR